ncbi:InlB B-repeat-containing protein [Agromyces badenianii]|uniref:InlB B-repeat-containing protein n=1 Tax=Agromyces badenianii TaxID=2080742 RepID=UPI001F1F81E0|nr:hypothetical protein [Agromyces badenianii]
MSKPGTAPAHATGDARTRVRWSSSSPFRRIAAILTSLALGAGLALVGVAAPASAHTGDLKATVECDTASGLYNVTYTLKLSNVSSGNTGTTKWRVGRTSFEGTPKNANGMDRGPITTTGNKTIVLGTDTLPGATKGNGPWVYAYTSWADKFGKGSDGRIEGLTGNCAKTPTKLPVPASPVKQDLCGTASDRIVPPAPTSGVEWTITPVVNGTATATATTKPGYEFIDGKTTKTFEFAFTDEPCIVTVEAVPSVKDVCGPDNETVALPADTDKVAWTSAKAGGVVTVTATAKKGFVFAEGPTKTWAFPVDDAPCVIEVVGAPTFSDTCGPDNETLTVPPSTSEIAWASSEEGGAITVTATAKPGYAFPANARTEWTYKIDDKPCIIEVVGEPTFTDTCGPDNEKLTLPTDTDTIAWSSKELDGKITVTATAKPGSAFPPDANTVWTFTIDDSPCVIPLVGEPTFSDTCGPENEKALVPTDTETIEWNSVRAGGVITVTATAKPGYTFATGGPFTWTFAYSDTACIEPTLSGTVATGVCEADSPWIYYDVELIDPDKQSTNATNTASLVLTDGTNTHTITLGDLVDGELDGKVLWPGASVDADGKANGWPGWALVGGQWIEVDDNFAWTRTVTEAKIVVNPEATVAISYPKAAPECATAPKGSGGAGSTPTASNGPGLASTGFTGTTIAIVAGVIVLAGIAFLVIARIRRKRS